MAVKGLIKWNYSLFAVKESYLKNPFLHKPWAELLVLNNFSNRIFIILSKEALWTTHWNLKVTHKSEHIVQITL